MNDPVQDRPSRHRQPEGVLGDPALEGYRGPQVCSIVGITYRQLDYWARTNLLRPSISDARGSGSQRRYSYTDLVQLKVIKRLLDAGISLQQARRAIECLRQSGEDLGAANLVIDGSRSVLARTGEEIVDLLKGGQTVLNIVPLGGVVSELDAAITELGLAAPGSASGPRALGAGLPPPAEGSSGGADAQASSQPSSAAAAGATAP